MPNIASLLRKIGAEAESNTEIFQQVISAKFVELLEDDVDGNNALHVAVLLKLDKVTEELIKRFATNDKLGLKNFSHETPLDIAIKMNEAMALKIAKAIEERCDAKILELEVSNDWYSFEDECVFLREVLNKFPQSENRKKLAELSNKIAQANINMAKNGGIVNSSSPFSYSNALVEALKALSMDVEGNTESERLAETATQGILAWIAENGSLPMHISDFSFKECCEKSKKFITRVRKADTDAIALKLREENAISNGEVEYSITNLKRAFTALRIPTWNQTDAQKHVTTAVDVLINLVKRGAEMDVREVFREYFNDERCKPFVQRLEDATMKSVNSSQELDL